MIEKGRKYTAKELQDILGVDWRKELGMVGVPFAKNKPIINTFDEFDDDTKAIYAGIYNIVKELNPNIEFRVWATGSRVKGYWRTDEEAEQLAKQYDVHWVKYSDYDYITDAPKKPSAEYFMERLKVKVDFVGGEDHKVLITV